MHHYQTYNWQCGFGIEANNVTIAVPCYDVTIPVTCYDVTVPAPCYDVTMPVPCYDVTIPVPCYDVIIPNHAMMSQSLYHAMMSHDHDVEKALYQSHSKHTQCCDQVLKGSKLAHCDQKSFNIYTINYVNTSTHLAHGQC